MGDCPSEEILQGFVDDGIAPAARDRVASHLSTCATCQSRVHGVQDDEALLADLRVAFDPGRRTGPADAAEIRPDAGVSGLSRYAIRERIGEGGMGIVYAAEQKSPRRPVALKILKPGVLSAGTLRRFAFEAEVLGRLDHPGIAGILEADTYEGPGERQPFFAMELVEGKVLTEFAAPLALRDRLQLFLLVCDAVEHAHQKGVIHRDLKPGNILVDARGQPKVLDFGIARAIDHEERTTTLRTQQGAFLGTLPYMSPEQLAGDSSRIDTRTDVYALGVILYEMLAGRRPLEVEGLTTPEALRMITEDEPPLLGVDRPELRGDLEAIAHTALAKERERRYASVGELAADIRRYLANEAVSVRVPGPLDQLRRFARRQRVLVAGVAVSFVLLVGGVVATTVQMLRAMRAETREATAAATARAAEALARERQREAEDETAGHRAARTFLQMVLIQAKPGDGRERNPTVLDALDEAERRLADRLGTEAVTRAAVNHTLGNVYRGLARMELARERLETALGLYEEMYGPEHFKVLFVLNDLSALEMAEGNFDEAERLARRALDMRHVLKPDDLNLLAGALGQMGGALYSQGQLERAERCLREAIEVYEACPLDLAGDIGVTTSNLALVIEGLGRVDEAEATFRRALAIKREAAGDRPVTASTMRQLASLLADKKEFAEAETLLTSAIAINRDFLGPGHPAVGADLRTLGLLLRRKGDREGAVARLREGLAIHRAARGEHPDVVHGLRLLAGALDPKTQAEEVEKLLRESAAMGAKILGDDHFLTMFARGDLCRLLLATKRKEEARSVYELLRPGLEDLAKRLPNRAKKLQTLEEDLK